jgi:hypothetical protein
MQARHPTLLELVAAAPSGPLHDRDAAGCKRKGGRERIQFESTPIPGSPMNQCRRIHAAFAATLLCAATATLAGPAAEPAWSVDTHG